MMARVVVAALGLLLLGASMIQWAGTAETVLPNGFILRGQSVVMSADHRDVLTKQAELVCFDDRFLIATPLQGGKHVVLDRLSPGPAGPPPQDREQALALLDAPGGCNGYFNRMIPPGLLHDAAEWPALPPCDSVNRQNPALTNRDWLERPCDAGARAEG